jgi:hypothetical protein
MISLNLGQLPFPLAVDEEYLSETEEGCQPDGIPSRMDLLLHTTKVIGIIEEMRAAARAPRLKLSHSGKESTVPDPGVILRVNSMVDDLLNQLPPHLRLTADYSNMSLNEDAVKCFRVQSHAIRFRLLLLRIFLLRPSLLAEAHRWTSSNLPSAQTASSMLQERLHQEICLLCLTTVHNILDEIHGSLTTQHQFSAWYALHCKNFPAFSLLSSILTPLRTVSFASATVLLVATLSPNLGVSLETEPTKSSWDKALAILNFHKAHIASAARGIEVLQRYRESITLRTSARLHATGPAQVVPDAMLLPPFSQGQHYQQQQLWVPQAMPTPPMAGVGMGEGLQEFLMSESLSEAWLTTQDFGQENWMLRY